MQERGLAAAGRSDDPVAGKALLGWQLEEGRV